MNKRKPSWPALAPALLLGVLVVWSVPVLAQDDPKPPGEDEEQSEPAEGEEEKEEPKPAEGEEKADEAKTEGKKDTEAKPEKAPAGEVDAEGEGEATEAEAAPAEEPAPVQPVEAAPAEEPAPVQPVEAAPAVEPAPVQPVDAAPAEEPAPVQPAEAAPAEEPAPVQPVEAAPSQSAAAEAEPAKGEANIEIDAILPTARQKQKLLRFQGIYEVHTNLISDDRSGDDWYGWYMLKANLNVTRHDRISLRMDLTQRYMADEDENGLWFGDMRLYYSRKLKIPLVESFAIPAMATLYLTAPTSRQSDARGYITRPTAILTLAPSYGPLTLVANGYFRYSFARYAESSQGDPNNQLTTGYDFQLIYAPLEWFAPSFTWQNIWDRQYDLKQADSSDSWRASYYFELALNFSVPMPEKWPALDVSLAYGQGSKLKEDGIFKAYFAKRDQSELYLGISLTY